ncbi:hypothetical protein AMTR_s00070p00198300 [Amborella trichopoda]|uniref:Uncharacterized protein n=1 Tax=Amborella trichopoda TaxID=13333 RepID=U5D505_AMBTC|nr:hypothetical protein AMTR_s00070p00198300 [Amborella trichopoda]
MEHGEPPEVLPTTSPLALWDEEYEPRTSDVVSDVAEITVFEGGDEVLGKRVWQGSSVVSEVNLSFAERGFSREEGTFIVLW